MKLFISAPSSFHLKGVRSLRISEFLIGSHLSLDCVQGIGFPPYLRRSPFQYYSYTAHAAIIGGHGEDDKGLFLLLSIGVITARSALFV